jgi:hypothetical protein
MGGARSYVAGNFEMQLDGISCGMIKSLEGMNVSADVIETAVSAFYTPRKNIGRLTYNDATVMLVGADSTPARTGSSRP